MPSSMATPRNADPCGSALRMPMPCSRASGPASSARRALLAAARLFATKRWAVAMKGPSATACPAFTLMTGRRKYTETRIVSAGA